MHTSSIAAEAACPAGTTFRPSGEAKAIRRSPPTPSFVPDFTTRSQHRLASPAIRVAAAAASTDPVFIDVCTNTTCFKKQGSGKTLRALEQMAGANVTVAECGCLGNCGKGPNVEFIIPGEEGVVFNGISSTEDAARFLEEHCGGLPADKAAEAYTLAQQGDDFAEKENWSSAEDAYTKALEIVGTNALVLTNRAIVRLKLGSPAAAVDDAEAACEANCDWAPAQLVASQAYEELEDFDNALRCCSNAYSIDNDLAHDGEFMNRVRWLKDVRA